jgi:hypothetical protein
MLYHRIRKKFIKLYLKECLEEFLALGGLKKIIIRRKLPAGHSLPEPFFWDLWGNLDHLRDSYTEYCAQEHLDPEKEAEESSSSGDKVTSFDTQ